MLISIGLRPGKWSALALAGGRHDTGFLLEGKFPLIGQDKGWALELQAGVRCPNQWAEHGRRIIRWAIQTENLGKRFGLVE